VKRSDLVLAVRGILDDVNAALVEDKPGIPGITFAEYHIPGLQGAHLDYVHNLRDFRWLEVVEDRRFQQECDKSFSRYVCFHGLLRANCSIWKGAG